MRNLIQASVLGLSLLVLGGAVSAAETPAAPATGVTTASQGHKAHHFRLHRKAKAKAQAGTTQASKKN